MSDFFLYGFGIYLGRFLRFNSWDIVQDFPGLLISIANIIMYPSAHWVAWAVTIVFGVGLLLLQKLCFKRNMSNNKPTIS